MKAWVIAWLVAGITCWAAQAAAAPSASDIELIKQRFSQERLEQASVEFASDGRLRLIGKFRDREEVQLAFNLAQQIAGVRWVAPTTPENVRYPGTEGMKSGILTALKKSQPKAAAPTSTEGTRYGLIVGVGHYVLPNISVIPNAADDARIMVRFLSERGFKQDNLKYLLEDQATKQNVTQAMKDLESRVGPNDTVVLFFSTHGAPPNDLGNASIVLHDTRIAAERKWVDPKTTVRDDDLKRFIEAVSPAKVVIILDVCYSGSAFERIPGFLASTSKDLFVEEATYATGISADNLAYVAGNKKEQEKILIAASGPKERSWNSSELKNGYFTYYLVSELQRKRDLQSAYISAKPLVQAEVKRGVAIPRGDPNITQTPQGTFIPDAATVKF